MSLFYFLILNFSEIYLFLFEFLIIFFSFKFIFEVKKELEAWSSQPPKHMLIFPLLRFSPPPLWLQRLPCQPLTPFSKISPKLPYPTIHSSPFSSPLRILPAKFSGYPRKFPNSLLSSYLASASAGEDEFEVELDRLLALLPEEMRRRVSEHAELHQLIEVVMDLGRKPLARFPSGDFVLSDCPITVQDIEFATSQVSLFFYFLFFILPSTCLIKRSRL